MGYEVVKSGIRSRILQYKICTLHQYQAPLVTSQSIKIFLLRKKTKENTVLLTAVIYFRVVQSHSENALSYASVNIKGFSAYLVYLTKWHWPKWPLISYGKHSPMELSFNKHTILVLINFIKLLISFQIQSYQKESRPFENWGKFSPRKRATLEKIRNKIERMLVQIKKKSCELCQFRMFQNCLRERQHCEIFISADDTKHFLGAKQLPHRNIPDPLIKPCEQAGNCSLTIQVHLILLCFTLLCFSIIGIFYNWKARNSTSKNL